MLVPISVKPWAQGWGGSWLVAGLSGISWAAWAGWFSQGLWKELLQALGSPLKPQRLLFQAQQPLFSTSFFNQKAKPVSTEENISSISREGRREYKLSVSQDNYIVLCTTYHFACFFHLLTLRPLLSLQEPRPPDYFRSLVGIMASSSSQLRWFRSVVRS